MTQEELAERASLSPTTIVRLENGEIRRPRPGTLEKLAEALRIDSSTLVWFWPEQPEPIQVGHVGRFSAVYQEDGDWWLGYVEELPGANSQERTLEECRESLKEAVELVLGANRELTRTEFEGKEVVREPLEV